HKGFHRLPHARDRSAKHGLYRIAGERFFERNNEIDMLEVFLEPPLYARRQFVHALEAEPPLAWPTEGDPHFARKFSHRGTKLTTHFDREQISVKVIPL